MYECVIIDDEIHAIETLKQYLALIPEFKIIDTFSDPVIALNFFCNIERVDLVLMDIDMPYISGIELAREIRKKTDKLIFTTAHTKYAFDAFDINASDYLLKPISPAKFIVTVQKLFYSLDENLKLHIKSPINNNFFFIKSREDNFKLIKIMFSDVIAIESKLNYINIHTLQKSLFTYMSLTEIGKIISPRDNFIQFQRSFIINKNYIEYIEGNIVKMQNSIKITVGKYYRKDFNEFVAKHIIKSKQK